MNPTIEVVRITGNGTDHLSLHTKRAQALRTVDEVGRLLWRRRFEYDLPAGSDPYAVIGKLRAEGWNVSIAEQSVEL